MMKRVHILRCATPLALATGLWACGGETAPQPPAPLGEAELAIVSADAGAPRDQLAREVDDLFTKDGLGETRAVLVMKDGKIDPLVSETFPLERAGEAIAKLEAREAVGKLVVTMD